MFFYNIISSFQNRDYVLENSFIYIFYIRKLNSKAPSKRIIIPQQKQKKKGTLQVSKYFYWICIVERRRKVGGGGVVLLLLQLPHMYGVWTRLSNSQAINVTSTQSTRNYEFRRGRDEETLTQWKCAKFTIVAFTRKLRPIFTSYPTKIY